MVQNFGNKFPQIRACVELVFRVANLYAVVTQLVEPQPSKLVVASSSLVYRSITTGLCVQRQAQTCGNYITEKAKISAFVRLGR